MGAWSFDALGNDDASDWVFELLDTKDLSLVEDALLRVLSQDGYLEAPDGEIGVAAAEVVARLIEKTNVQQVRTEPLDEWIAQYDRQPKPELISDARSVISRVFSEPSELLELWRESEDFQRWESAMRDISARLSAG